MRNLEKNTFTKEALALAWRYFLPPYTFQIRVGALYLLYGLYNTQLCQPKQKVLPMSCFPPAETQNGYLFLQQTDLCRNASVSKFYNICEEDLHLITTFLLSCLQIRVALKDWDEVLKFQQDLINAQHYDAAYIFRKLRLDKAFHFTAMPKLVWYLK